MVDSPSPDLDSSIDPQGTASSSETSRSSDPLRAAIENMLFLLGGTLWYVIDDRNVLDWDLESWDQRFSEESYRFDNNGFAMNFLAHPLSGAAFYGVPRANGLSMPVAALYGIASSFIWEFFIEFKERFSINDAIATPLGGVAIGEALYRMARFFTEEMHPALAWIFGLPVAMHEALDGRPVGRDSPRARPPGQDLRFGYGFGWAFGDAFDFDVHALSAAARFVLLPGLGKPGPSSGIFFDAEVSSMRVDGFFSTEGVGLQLFADTMLFGAYAADRSDLSGRAGSRLIVGTSVSQLYRKERYERWRDRLAFTGFPGLAVDAEERAGAFGVRASGRLQGGFGASHAPSFGAWREQHADDVTKTILSRHGYYYGWGWLGSVELEVSVPWLTLGGSAAYLALSSQEGLDRRQDLVENDVHADDELLELAAWARVTGLWAGLFVEASYRAQLRRSELGETELSRELHRYQLALGMAL